MKGHVPTPEDLAESIVRSLSKPHQFCSDDRILYPGSGTAPFAAAVERLCNEEGWGLPQGLGVELDPVHISAARERELEHVQFEERDFLADDFPDTVNEFDYIVGNPPYVPIEGLNDSEKSRYREKFSTATGRFDLYILFFEQAVELLAEGGRLSFVTPEKFEYVETASPLRRLLTNGDICVESIEHLDENAFKGDITFPCVTTLHRNRSNSNPPTRVRLRDGTQHEAQLPTSGDSWASNIRGISSTEFETGVTLEDVTTRISPGMATGADKVFVKEREEVSQLYPEWAFPTVSGSQLTIEDGPRTDSVLVCPYDETGDLPSEDELGVFGEWAKLHSSRLKDRSCVKKEGKRWYAWHESPPMEDLLQKKIVFKDISREPQFWAEREGDVIPRHSVYYLIPKQPDLFDDLLEYLNGPKARAWMEANCQKAANGFLRLQTRVLEDLPVPADWIS